LHTPFTLFYIGSMTAEVVLMNKQAVAMAADSAGTIGGKILNSNNKLFMLSKRYPVGVMIYGSAEIMGYPWETIVKMYRETLKEKSFSTLSEQVRHFLEYLRSLDSLGEQAEKIYIENAFESVARDISYQVGLFHKNVLAVEDFDKIISDIKLDYKYRLIDSGVSDSDKLELLAKYKNSADELISKYFESYRITQKMHDEIYSIMKNTVFHNPNRYMGSSGLVFSGFGNNDIFPITESLVIASVLKKEIMMGSHKKYSIDAAENIAAILPFAQEEIIDSFVYGIDPNLNDTIRTQVTNILTKVPDIVSNYLQNFDSSQKDVLSDILSKTSQEFLKLMENYINSKYSFPLLQGVSSLSPGELASMAETLVSLTSFRKKISADQRETVGGPTDVAVITKGDGFIWINRKHYFDPNKNHHFFSNYHH